MGEAMGQDSRFAKLGTEKKFRSLGKKHKKVKIDSRFQVLYILTELLKHEVLDYPHKLYIQVQYGFQVLHIFTELLQ